MDFLAAYVSMFWQWLILQGGMFIIGLIIEGLFFIYFFYKWLVYKPGLQTKPTVTHIKYENPIKKFLAKIYAEPSGKFTGHLIDKDTGEMMISITADTRDSLERKLRKVKELID